MQRLELNELQSEDVGDLLTVNFSVSGSFIEQFYKRSSPRRFPGTCAPKGSSTYRNSKKSFVKTLDWCRAHQPDTPDMTSVIPLQTETQWDDLVETRSLSSTENDSNSNAIKKAFILALEGSSKSTVESDESSNHALTDENIETWAKTNIPKPSISDVRIPHCSDAKLTDRAKLQKSNEEPSDSNNQSLRVDGRNKSTRSQMLRRSIVIKDKTDMFSPSRIVNNTLVRMLQERSKTSLFSEVLIKAKKHIKDSSRSQHSRQFSATNLLNSTLGTKSSFYSARGKYQGRFIC
jgi:hypothetical protein